MQVVPNRMSKLPNEQITKFSCPQCLEPLVIKYLDLGVGNQIQIKIVDFLAQSKNHCCLIYNELYCNDDDDDINLKLDGARSSEPKYPTVYFFGQHRGYILVPLFCLSRRNIFHPLIIFFNGSCFFEDLEIFENFDSGYDEVFEKVILNKWIQKIVSHLSILVNVLFEKHFLSGAKIIYFRSMIQQIAHSFQHYFTNFKKYILEG